MKIQGVVVVIILILNLSFGIEAASFTSYSKNKMLGTQVKLSYDIVTIGSDKYAKFLIEKTAGGHVAFGIGSSMSSADIVLLQRTFNIVTLSDCRLTGQMAPTCGESEDAWSFYTSQSESSDVGTSSMKVEIKRKLAASGSDSDKAITEGSENTFIYSYTTNDLAVQHDSTGTKGTISINLSSYALIRVLGIWTVFTALSMITFL